MLYVSCKNQRVAGVDVEAGELLDDELIDRLSAQKVKTLLSVGRIGFSSDAKLRRRFDAFKPPRSARLEDEGDDDAPAAELEPEPPKAGSPRELLESLSDEQFALAAADAAREYGIEATDRATTTTAMLVAAGYERPESEPTPEPPEPEPTPESEPPESEPPEPEPTPEPTPESEPPEPEPTPESEPEPDDDSAKAPGRGRRRKRK